MEAKVKRSRRPGSNAPTKAPIKSLALFLWGIFVGICISGITVLIVLDYRAQVAFNQRIDEAIAKGRKEIERSGEILDSLHAQIGKELDSTRLARICKERPSVCNYIS